MLLEYPLEVLLLLLLHLLHQALHRFDVPMVLSVRHIHNEQGELAHVVLLDLYYYYYN
jgi:hypothetical protein